MNLGDLLFQSFNDTAAVGEKKNPGDEKCHPVNEGLDVLGDAGGDNSPNQSNSSLGCHQYPIVGSEIIGLPSQVSFSFSHSEQVKKGLQIKQSKVRNYHNHNNVWTALGVGGWSLSAYQVFFCFKSVLYGHSCLSTYTITIPTRELSID